MNNAQKVIKWCAVALAVLIICSIVSAIVGAGMIFGRIFGGWHDDVPGTTEIVEIEDETESELEDTELAELHVDVKSVSVQVARGEKLKVESNAEDVVVSRNETGLYVTEKEYNFFKHWGFSDGGEVIITLPGDLTDMEKVVLTGGAGRLEIADLVMKELRLSVGAGRTELRNLQVTEKAKVDGGAGLLVIKKSEFKDLDFDMGVGKTELEARLLGSTKIDAGVGKLELTLLGEEDDYRVKVDHGIGSVTQDGLSLDNAKGENLVDIDGGVGAIEIRLRPDERVL